MQLRKQEGITKQQTMKLAFIQTQIKDFQIETNYLHFQSLLEKIDNDTDLLVLPEMFLTGFTADTSLAKESKEKGVSLMQKFVEEKGIAIEGSLIVEDNGKYFNRHYAVLPNETKYYDKIHLFSLSDEAKHLSKGQNKDVVFSHKGFNIKMLTCYDLRFPLVSMNRIFDEKPLYDILIYVASWPKSRREQWLTLLKARAIENNSFVLGVNRIGEDGVGVEYSGDSVLFNSKGQEITATHIVENAIHYFEINKEDLDLARQKFPTWKDWDKI